MQNLFIKLALTSMLALHYSTYTLSIAHTQKQIFTFDCDDVVNIRGKMGFSEIASYMSLIVKVTWHQPHKAAKLLWNWRAIKKRGHEISEHMQGATNIIHALSKELVAQRHADIAPYTEEIISYFVKPKPIWQVINYIKELKKQGYTIIGATNQDYCHNKYFRKRMQEQGVCIEELFDAIVVSHTVAQAKERYHEHEIYHEVEPGVFMPSSRNGHKPHEDFYKAVKAVGHKLVPTASLFIHSDDKLENIHGAHSVEGFQAIHFKLPQGKSARKCTAAELEATYLAWKSDIDQLFSARN